jgi:hypothetical protein
MKKQSFKYAVLSVSLFGLALGTSTSLAQVGRASKFPATHPSSAAAHVANHPAKDAGGAVLLLYRAQLPRFALHKYERHQP